MIGRVLTGIGVGGYTYVARLYIAEMSPNKYRAQNIAIIEVFYMIGIEIAYLFGFGITLTSSWWRIMLGVNFLICGLHIIITVAYFNYDTPIFTYIQKSNIMETKQILKRIYVHDEDIDQVANEIIRVSKDKIEQSSISYLDLFRNKYKVRTLVCITLIAASVFVGVDSLIYFSEYIFHAYVSHDTSKLYVNILGGCQLISSLIAISFVEHLGRKKLLIIGHLTIFLTLITLGLLYLLNISNPYIYLFTVLISLNAITVNPVTNIYLTDVLPEKGLALSYTFYYIFKLILTLSFKSIINSPLNYPGLFLIYASLTFLAVIFIIFKVKESHGKTLKELVDLY